MNVRRGAAAGLVGLALAVGSAGCGGLADKAADKVAEKAVEANTGCTDVDIDSSNGGVSANCEGEDFNVSAGGEASLPDAWPSDLAPPADLKIVAANTSSNPTAMTVIGSLDGDVNSVYDAIKAQVTAAGYTIESDNVTDVGGSPTGTLVANGSEWTVAVAVSNVANALEGDVTVTYTLTEAAG